MIEISDVSKSFGDVVALSRLNMTVSRGQITGFLGPNGAGKSTTLKLIMGEIRPDKGQVRVFDEDPYNNSRLKKRVGYVSEHEDLYPWMKGLQFISSFARLILPREQARLAAKEALSRVGLDVEGKKIKAYSKGMKQRLKLAAAIVHNPDLLILDEPFGGLDPFGRREIKELIVDLNRQGVIVLISSHILYELDEISSRMVLIHRGQALAEGSPEEIITLINQFPHKILFSGPYAELQTLSQLLIKENVIKSLDFLTEKVIKELIVVTNSLSDFYPVVNRVIAENDLLIQHLESQTDNIEAIFDFLV